jgi:hypothetical protein
MRATLAMIENNAICCKINNETEKTLIVAKNGMIRSKTGFYQALDRYISA